MTWSGFAEWMDAVRAAGLDKRTAIIPSVLPSDSVEKAQELQRCQTYGPIGDAVVDRIAGAADPAGEGVAIAAEIAGRFEGHVRASGAFTCLCGGCESLAGEVIKRAKI